MARLGSVLAHIVSLASLTIACSDEESRGTCYGNPGPHIYDVPIISGNAAGAGGADAGAGAGGAGELDCAAYCALGDSCEIVESSGQLSARCSRQQPATAYECPPPGVSVGRRPEGVHAPHGEGGDEATLAAFFAQVAHLEAASIHAFVRLGHELRAHGAGDALVKSARKAARDEVRHASQMSRFARRYGGKVPRVRLEAVRERSLFELARENELEGCVRETFGAAVALWQAEHAGTTELRGVFAEIARDETTHAQLAWQLRSWLLPKLSEAERAELERVQRAAFDDLKSELAAEPPTKWRQVAGLPDAATATLLLSLFAERLLPAVSSASNGSSA